MCFYDSLGQGKAQTSTALFVCFERLEDGFQTFGRDSAAIVFYLYGQDIILPADREPNAALI